MDWTDWIQLALFCATFVCVVWVVAFCLSTQMAWILW